MDNTPTDANQQESQSASTSDSTQTLRDSQPEESQPAATSDGKQPPDSQAEKTQSTKTHSKDMSENADNQSADDLQTATNRNEPTANEDKTEESAQDNQDKQNDDASQLLHSRIVRLHADIENMQRRHQKELSNAHKFGLEAMLRDILPVLDSFDMALKSCDSNKQPEALVEGMKLTYKMLVDALVKNGLQTVDPKGKPFDPGKHEAMTMQPSGQFPENTVIEVVQKGYLLNERLIRPALVIVASKETQKQSDKA